jgi:hypothetical protein
VRRFLPFSLVLYPVGNCERKNITFFEPITVYSQMIRNAFL